MGNCLVTKLKDVVNNNNLVELGYIRLKFSAKEVDSMVAWYGKYTLHYDGEEPVTGEMAASTLTIPANKSGYVDVEMRSGLNILQYFDCDNFDSLCFYNADGLDLLYLSNTSGNLDNLGVNMTRLIVNGNSNITGNINDPKSINYTQYLFEYNTVPLAREFNINTFAANQVARGRISGECECTFAAAITIIRFGSSMVNPTAEETEQGYQIA